jgi:nitroimidazol reductase NimA-like FMN-containing flavoprotein (pyridoxamine 5'-phosphate oxidase superfamily)
MRRKDRKLKNEEVVEILTRGEYGVLSTLSPDGYPYGVPVSYVFFNDAIYFHGARAGHKFDNLASHDQVSFCVVGKTRVLPDKFSTEYESAIVFGKAAEVFDEERTAALVEILRKYSPEDVEKGKESIARAGQAFTVIKIQIDHMSGKAKR